MWELVLSFYHVGFKDYMQNIGGKFFYLLSHLTGPILAWPFEKPAQAGLEFTASLLSQPLECREFKCKPPHLIPKVQSVSAASPFDALPWCSALLSLFSHAFHAPLSRANTFNVWLSKPWCLSTFFPLSCSTPPRILKEPFEPLLTCEAKHCRVWSS